VANPTDHRYLLENQTPEWKRAYIDYRAAKKAIKVVALRLNEASQKSPGINGNGEERDTVEYDSSGDEDYGPSAPPKKPASVGSGKGRTPTSPRAGTAGTAGSTSTTPKVSRTNVSPSVTAISSAS
jgi:hypothetical protein